MVGRDLRYRVIRRYVELAKERRTKELVTVLRFLFSGEHVREAIPREPLSAETIKEAWAALVRRVHGRTEEEQIEADLRTIDEVVERFGGFDADRKQ